MPSVQSWCKPAWVYGDDALTLHTPVKYLLLKDDEEEVMRTTYHIRSRSVREASVVNLPLRYILTYVYFALIQII